MLNFILGKSKTGKTTHIYNMIEQDIASKKDVILFVPSQTRAKAENQYMEITQKSGVMGVNITTISEFVEENLKSQNLHIDEKYLSKLDRKIILTQVIKENPDIFNAFDKVKNYPGFLDAMDIYVDLFRKNEIEREKYENIKLDDKRIDIKFKEILAVYEKYIEKMKSSYIDSVDEMQLFVKNIKKCSSISSNTKVYFDGYNNFSNSEYKFIDALMSQSVDITITLDTDITKIEDTYTSSSIFENSNNTYKKLCAIANKNKYEAENIVKYTNVFGCKDDLKYIANNLFSQENNKKIEAENMEVIVQTNVIKEIESVAEDIQKYIKSGYRFSDFAIYTTNIEEYEKTISRVFYENKLQIYIPKNKNVSESILVKYIQSILRLASRGLNLENIFETLKLGLTDVEIKNVYLLENYMKEFNVNKYIVDNDFYLNNEKNSYDLAEINNIKKSIVNIFSPLTTLKDMNAKQIIQALYEHLQINNIFTNFDSLIKDIEKEANNLDIVNFESQVWNKLSDIFNSIIKVYKNQKISIEEFENIFNLVVKDIKIKTLPPTKDQIELVDINNNKVEPKKVIFFIGVVEGKFPQKVDEDIFFRDNELEKLKNSGIDIKETTISKYNMYLFNIYEALNNVKEKLYIYIPAATLDGKATRKSSLITLLEQICIFKINGEVTKDGINNDIYSTFKKEELFSWLVKNIQNLDEEDISKLEEIVSVYNYLKEDEKYCEILDFKKDDSNLNKEIVDIIYDKEFQTSVSKLELYRKCPFSYYMQYILKVMPNKEAKVNVLELGSFMHGVLERFSKYLLNKEIKWQEILEDDLENVKAEYQELLEKIVDEEIENILCKQKQSVKYMVLKRKLITTMKKVIKTIALSYNQSEFEPYDYEIEFNDKSVFLPMEIKLDDNRTMKLVGKIDRVDMLKLNDIDYVRVVDYKSSSKDLKLDDIKEGLSLQLITYLITFMENKREMNIKPAGMLYFNLSDKLVSLAQYEENDETIKKELLKRLKMKGIFLKDALVLDKMDRNFSVRGQNSLIDISPQSLAKENSQKAIAEDEFESLCKEAKNILKEIGKEVSSGIVKIRPNKHADYCKYCNYSSTCRKNISL